MVVAAMIWRLRRVAPDKKSGSDRRMSLRDSNVGNKEPALAGIFVGPSGFIPGRRRASCREHRKPVRYRSWTGRGQAPPLRLAGRATSNTAGPSTKRFASGALRLRRRDALSLLDRQR